MYIPFLLTFFYLGHLEEDFKQPMYLCPVDLRKLQVLCGFDVIQRYEGLLVFFSKHDMAEEAEWVQSRITYIKDKRIIKTGQDTDQ